MCIAFLARLINYFVLVAVLVAVPVDTGCTMIVLSVELSVETAGVFAIQTTHPMTRSATIPAIHAHTVAVVDIPSCSD